MNEIIYELWYSTENGGDGSAYPVFFNTKTAAELHQKEHNKDGDGWAEDCTGVAQLSIRDGRINLVTNHWIKEAGRNERRYAEIPTAPETMELLRTRFNDLVKIENEHKTLVRNIEIQRSAK